LKKNLADDSASNRATREKVQHSFVVVSADGDQAEVADQLRDLSVVVDPATHEPLSGQSASPTADTAPLINAIVDLHCIDNTWKVVRAGQADARAQTP
jgi:hypothetical protein